MISKDMIILAAKAFSCTRNYSIRETCILIVENPDVVLPITRASSLCLWLEKYLDSKYFYIANDTYRLLAIFTFQASQMVQDRIIPKLVLHDL